jgi:hypothetical protein
MRRSTRKEPMGPAESEIAMQAISARRMKANSLNGAIKRSWKVIIEMSGT